MPSIRLPSYASATRDKRDPRWIASCILALCLLASLYLLSFQVPLRSSSAEGKEAIHVSAPVRLSGKGIEGRVLVVGGGADLGYHLTRRLLSSSTRVTVIDQHVSEEALVEHTADIHDSSALLRVLTADVLDEGALDLAMSDDVVGVIHLAAASQKSWCLENERACRDMAERRTAVVLDSLSGLGHRTGTRPWFVLASSSELHGKSETFPPANAYGRALLSAEQAVAKHTRTLKTARRAGSLYSIILRLSSLYGGEDDQNLFEELVPQFATQALSHLPIQLINEHRTLDLLHIDDCVNAFLLSIQRLASYSASFSYFASGASFETFNISSGSRISVAELADKLIRLTRSKSPIQRLHNSRSGADAPGGSTEQASLVLQFEPLVSIEEGLLRLVRRYLERTQEFLSAKVQNTCYDAASTIEENGHIRNLDACQAHISVDIQGRLGALWAKDGWWRVDDSFVPTLADVYVRQNEAGKWLVRFSHWEDKHIWLGIRDTPIATGGADIYLGVWDEEVEDGKATIEWELEVNAEDAMVRLVLPNSDYQLAPPTFYGGDLTFVSKEADIWPFRITPVCCPGPSPWPFFSEDPIEQSIEYTRTSPARYFAASGPKTVCSRLERALKKAERDLATLDLDLFATNHSRPMRFGTASDWANANLPACTNLCDHPLVCVDTGDCQCVLPTCPPKPLVSSSSLRSLADPPLAPTSSGDESRSLVAMVGNSSWLDVLRPHAARFIRTGTPWPSVHVSPMSPRGEEWRNDEWNDYDKLREEHCFSADSSMEQAMAPLSVPPEEADMVFMPFYSMRAPELFDETWEYVRDTVKTFDPHKLIIPFTHDWGACLTFEWNVWALRSNSEGRYKRTDDVVGWSVMGDLNSPCYKPLQDVVIPPRTCLSPALYDSFGDMSKVRPARERTVLATFSGSFWGTGEFTRQKVTCSRPMPQQTESRGLVSAQNLTTIWGHGSAHPSYIVGLNDTIFCPQVAGIAGWAPRLTDSIYAGCIPVFIGGTTQSPFYDMLDWGKISVQVEARDLQRLEEVLMRYAMEEVERMQANLMLVRDAFVYPLDGQHQDQLHTRGPLFYALHSTKMRLMTEYPMGDMMDRPNWVPSQ